MKPDQQRIAIFKACGYHFYEGRATWLHGRPPTFRSDDADPLTDLNAMAEAEKVIRAKRFTFALYRDWLLKICNPQHDPLSKEWTDEENENALSATAAQRAEAFLRTIGKWIESTQEVAA